MKATIRNFLQMESAGGVVLMGAAALAPVGLYVLFNYGDSVGFAMSLFIDTLAFQNLPADAVFDFDARLGILLGSLASGVLGYIVLDRTLPRTGH